MLDESLLTPQDDGERRRKWLLMPLSLLVHALAIAALVIVPLLLAENKLPEIKVTNVLVMTPLLPTAPAASAPAAGQKERLRNVQARRREKRHETARFHRQVDRPDRSAGDDRRRG